jgi:hypothetical protein
MDVLERKNAHPEIQRGGNFGGAALEQPGVRSLVPLAGLDPAGTTPTQLTGSPFGTIFTPPLITLGSLNIRVTSACIAKQASGDA